MNSAACSRMMHYSPQMYIVCDSPLSRPIWVYHFGETNLFCAQTYEPRYAAAQVNKMANADNDANTIQAIAEGQCNPTLHHPIH